MVDIDGVISLFGFADSSLPDPVDGGTRSDELGRTPDPKGSVGPGPLRSAAKGGLRSVEGSFHAIDGIPHFLSSTAAAHLLALSAVFELVWASGWEEKANEYLPHLLGLPAPLPFVRFSGGVRGTKSPHAHWKLESIEAYAGARSLAWIDDAFNPACHAWARARPAPTLLVGTAPERGLTTREAELLMAWARSRSQIGQRVG